MNAIDRAMLRASLAALLMLVAPAGAVRAGPFDDPEQEKSWFFLQRIAKDIRELENCLAVVGAHGGVTRPYLAQRQKKAELFVDQADAYVQHYGQSRGKEESLREFRFRVWSVALDAGREDARSMS